MIIITITTINDNDENNRYAASSSSSTSSSHHNQDSNKRPKITHAYVIISSLSSSSSSSSSTSTALHSLSTNTNEWILDGGATDHYASNINMLHDVVTLSQPRYIITANGSSICNTKGKVTINVDDHHQIILNDVLYVPDFHVNLISVHKIVSGGAIVTYTKDRANIIRNNHIELSVPKKENLYVLTSSTSTAHTSSSTSSTSSSSSTTSNTSTPVNSSPNKNIERIANEIYRLHLKHGHVNYKRLIKMIKNKCVNYDNIELMNKITNENEILKQLKAHLCEGCLKGKMTRSGMTGKIEYDVHDIMDLWVCDTMIILIPTMNGCIYIFLIMDVHSSKLFISLHRTKDEIASAFINIIKQQQTQTDKILKRVHSDNGTEVKNGKVKAFLDSQGTIFTTSTPYTPQHNALIERKNRTVIEMTKSMMFHANAYIRMYRSSSCKCIYNK
jgi:hypothetical protein